MKLVNIVGARPNFMKIAPLMEAYAAAGGIDALLVHTGQHYDAAMSALFFDELGITEPDINLGIGGGTHTTQTAEIMKAVEPVLVEQQPDAVVVVGDVNSTIACGLVAVKLGIKLVHVEAGLRSFDRSMPEEINRVLTDAISDLLFCTEESGRKNLHNEGCDPVKIHLVGNVMVDSLLRHRERAEQSGILDALGVDRRAYAVLTLHRPSNVDNPATLRHILEALQKIQESLPIVFPIHPRTRKNIETFDLGGMLRAMPNLIVTEPAGYLDFLRLTSSARVVLTDSGGIQEESTIVGVPCLTLRDNTERPVTCELGTNQLVGSDPHRILGAFERVMQDPPGSAQIPPLWDGRAAERIVAVLREAL